MHLTFINDFKALDSKSAQIGQKNLFFFFLSVLRKVLAKTFAKGIQLPHFRHSHVRGQPRERYWFGINSNAFWALSAILVLNGLP